MRQHLWRRSAQPGPVREALELDLSLLPRFDRVFGADHQRTLNVRNNIAADYRRLGRHQDALNEDQKTLSDRRRIFGSDDPITLTSLDAVARDLRDLGHYQESLDMARKVVEAIRGQARAGESRLAQRAQELRGGAAQGRLSLGRPPGERGRRPALPGLPRHGPHLHAPGRRQPDQRPASGGRTRPGRRTGPGGPATGARRSAPRPTWPTRRWSAWRPCCVRRASRRRRDATTGRPGTGSLTPTATSTRSPWKRPSTTPPTWLPAVTWPPRSGPGRTRWPSAAAPWARTTRSP